MMHNINNRCASHAGNALRMKQQQAHRGTSIGPERRANAANRRSDFLAKGDDEPESAHPRDERRLACLQTD